MAVTKFRKRAGVLAALILSACSPPSPAPEEPAKPEEHETLSIEGWSVHVDTRLVAGGSSENEALGRQALSLLEEELKMINGLDPVTIPEKLKQIPIWLDLWHGDLSGEMYHPDDGWLGEHGYSTDLWRCVQIPRASQFVDQFRRAKEPVPILHQLIHAFHDRAFGLEDAEIEAAYDRYKASGKGENVRLANGQFGPHPALVSSREYFMEMTLAYANSGRSEPMNREELRRLEPASYELIRSSWENGLP